MQTAAKKHCRIARIVRTQLIWTNSRNAELIINHGTFLSFFLKRKIEDLKEKNFLDGQVEIGLNIHD